jgi:NAD-dependent deacetylase
MSKYDQLKHMINTSNKIVVITGAGISCPPPTNIKDFRSSDGLYSKGNKYNLPTEDLLSYSFFEDNTRDFFEFYGENLVYPNAIYNDAHKYFADLGKQKDVTIITQNVDDLHNQAGSDKVIELHGNSNRNYCILCKKQYTLKEISFEKIPICSCGGVIRPDVVLYGESVSRRLLIEARECIAEADMLIVVGTSLTVYPAAGLIKYFKGKNFVIINKSETQYDDAANLVFNDDILEVINNIKKANIR